MKFSRLIRKSLAVILMLILIALVVLNVYIIICAGNGKATVIGGNCIMRVSTGSMYPSISAGDYIIVKSIPTKELNVGDIISFYSEDNEIYGRINTHRIVQCVEDGFVTRGDANSADDGAVVHYERIIGKYIGKARYFRWLDSFKSTRKLIVLTVMLITLSISVYEVITISKIKSKITEDNDKIKAEEHEKLLREAIEKEKIRLRRENFKQESNISCKGESDTGDDKS